VARARQQATGRFSLRITRGGFGTPEFGAESRRVRVAHGTLIVETDGPACRSHTVAGKVTSSTSQSGVASTSR
jgi:hypothetical protein